MKARIKKKEPEIISHEGKPVAVILDIDDYREILERLEDADDLNILAYLRKQPPRFKDLKDLLKEYQPKRISKDEVFQAIEENREKIKSYGVRRLGLFGSLVRGEATEASDLDFVVDLENHTFDAYMDLKFFLEELFECEVDLVPADSIKPGLRDAILGETIYAKGL